MYVILQVIYILCGQMIVNNHTLDFENANVRYMAAPFSLVSPISCSSLTNVYGTLRLNWEATHMACTAISVISVGHKFT